MIYKIKKVLYLLVFVLLTPAVSYAYELSVTQVEEPFEVIRFKSDMNTGQAFLGELQDFPVMYEVAFDESKDFDVVIKQRYRKGAEPHNFSLIVVKQIGNNSGVKEISRLHPMIEDWKIVKDSATGMTFWKRELSSQSLEPGVYKVEISTADNSGKYLLTFGNQDDKASYFATLSNIRTTQKFFNYPFFRILSSSYVYYPLGILILIFTAFRIRRYRNYTKNAH